MEDLREYLYNEIEIEKNSIQSSRDFLKWNTISVLNEFHQESIVKSEAKIEAYENMLEKMIEKEQHGIALPF